MKIQKDGAVVQDPAELVKIIDVMLIRAKVGGNWRDVGDWNVRLSGSTGFKLEPTFGAFRGETDDTVDYVQLDENGTPPVQSLAFGDGLSRDQALEMVRNLVH